MEFLKTFSDFDKASQEMNLACMSGQFDNILYPNNNETLFGITFNETCGEYIDYFRIPEGIHVPDNSTMNFKVRIKMDRQVDSEVFRLLPGNSGIRFDDLVGVMGTVSLIIYYTDLHTGQQIKAKVNRTFLDKFKSSDTPLIGHYEDTIQVSVNLPVTVDIFGRTPLYQIITIINISTYTGKNFKPGEVLQTARQYALVDFRKLGSISPEITPDIAKRGAGGGHLQWYKVCFPSATEE